MAAVHSSRRRDARRAARLGVTVTRRTDAQAMDAFYHLQVLTRRRHGLPTQPRGFFHRLRRLFAAGLGYLLVAEWEGHTVAAAVYLRFGDTLVHKYGASDPAHLKLRANSLVYVEAIHHACEEGCTVLDFGRTELDNPGLRAFKLSFGAQERTLRYSWIGRQRDPASVRSVSHWQQSVIRRAPPVLGRVIGAAVYRHFA